MTSSSYLNKKSIVMLSCVGTLLVAGCAGEPTREQTGAVVGGVVGGVLGAQVGKGHGRDAAIVVGTLVGAMVGGSVGRYMDEQDRMKTAQTLEYNRDHQPSTWKNPNTKYEYTATPVKTYDSEQGPCREYNMEASVGGKSEQVYGTACRQNDGSWKIVN